MLNNTSTLFESPKDKLIIALDNFNNFHEIQEIIEETSHYAGWYKAGLESIIAFGAKTMIDCIHSYGSKAFLDGKFFDIPNTTANTSEKAGFLKANMMDLHCSNGVVAMKKAVEKNQHSALFGVTVLTSFSEEECIHIYGAGVNETVLKFAKDAKEAGLHGIICSPQELLMLNQYPELHDLLKVTPGIQPLSMQANDQTRIMTPTQAIQHGSTAIVVGRAITEQKDRKGAAEKIMLEIEKAMVTA